MITYEAMTNILLQFGIFLATALTAVVAIIVAMVITQLSELINPIENALKQGLRPVVEREI
ncbi:hypothetical protein [Sporosarcina limicola]|uniref:Cell division protein ZapA (FtsZ GTPase activity inhibitor) n=1 Tax=Sporosarcina limicola TaxID=34101 RepID=A0A927R4P1_9BACL|nr:hypothetical protein [Sporosarcina limicola]MBE1556426.1 cell division protein ZapA (FtsZ GTPase activity inhibitor) [Sporosarcina limicola]